MRKAAWEEQVKCNVQSLGKAKMTAHEKPQQPTPVAEACCGVVACPIAQLQGLGVPAPRLGGAVRGGGLSQHGQRIGQRWSNMLQAHLRPGQDGP